MKTLNITNLLNGADATMSVRKQTRIKLTASINNHSLFNKIGTVGSSSWDDYVANAGGEYIKYAVFQQPFVASDNGANLTYSMVLHVSSNFAYYPKIYDAFSQQMDSDRDSYLNAEVGRAAFDKVKALQNVTKALN